MERGIENKNLSLEKTVLIMWAQICGIIAWIVQKMTSKKIICKIRTSRGEIFALRNLRPDLHIFLDNIELRIENNN